MKSLVMFHASCGHTEVHEVSAERFEQAADPERRHTALGVPSPNRSRTGRTMRMVYVYPDRFCLCSSCAEEEMKSLVEEMKR